MYMLLHPSKSILHFKCSLELVCTLISSGEPWRTKCNICTLKAMSVQEKSNSPIQTSSRLTASSSFTCYSCDLKFQISTQISRPYARVLDTLRLFLAQVVPIRKSQASFFPSSLEFIFLLHFSFTYIFCPFQNWPRGQRRQLCTVTSETSPESTTQEFPLLKLCVSFKSQSWNPFFPCSSRTWSLCLFPFLP